MIDLKADGTEVCLKTLLTMNFHSILFASVTLLAFVTSLSSSS